MDERGHVQGVAERLALQDSALIGDSFLDNTLADLCDSGTSWDDLIYGIQSDAGILLINSIDFGENHGGEILS